MLNQSTKRPRLPVNHSNAGRRHTLKKLVPETGNKLAPETHKDASSSQFIAPKQLSSQSRCMVCVMCQTVSVMEQSWVLLRARNFYQKKTCTRLTDTCASFWYKFPVAGIRRKETSCSLPSVSDWMVE